MIDNEYIEILNNLDESEKSKVIKCVVVNNKVFCVTIKGIINLVNRQKEDNEELKQDREKLFEQLLIVMEERIKEERQFSKIEGAKEFWEKLKQKKCAKDSRVIYIARGDELLKEMEGEE